MQETYRRLLADITNPPSGTLAPERLAEIVTAELEGQDVDALYPQEMRLIESQVELAEAYSQLAEQLGEAFDQMGAAETPERPTAVLFTMLPKPHPDQSQIEPWGLPLVVSTNFIGRLPAAQTRLQEPGPQYDASSKPVTPQHWPLFKESVRYPRPLTLSVAAERLSATRCSLQILVLGEAAQPLSAIPVTITTPTQTHKLITDTAGQAVFKPLDIEAVPQLTVRLG